MMTTIPKAIETGTFLSPGQRFRSSDIFSGRNEYELVVSRVVLDPLGLLHVVLRVPGGREISAFAEQVEAAIAAGHLAPIGVAEPFMVPA